MLAVHGKERPGRGCRFAVAALLLVASAAGAADNRNVPTPSDYRIVDLKPIRLDVTRLGLTDCTSMLALSATRAVAACRSKKNDNQTDFGLRVYVLATDGPHPRVLSASKGLGDAYSITLQKRSNPTAIYQDLVLADTSAEYAYGTAVYQLRGDGLRYLGEIGYVLMSSDDTPVSALDAIKIQATPDGFRVSFAQDVFAIDKSGEYRRLDASKTFDMYDGKALRHVR